MENQVTESVLDMRAAYAEPSSVERASVESASVERAVQQAAVREAQELPALKIPVGTNLADVERWMIFATLQKCAGNKTRAAALLGVSLKTLYNRLNAYRAQGLAMDYAPGEAGTGDGRVLASLDGVHARADELHG